MAKIEDCPGFETFGADVKEARKAKNLARKDLAEKVNIDTRYLANIEEIVIAAKNPDKEEIKYEISDFLYHAMVLMVEKGVTWEDITRELARR